MMFTVPKGWKLVPLEPTEAMHAAANKEWDGRASARSAGVYEAMLAAAPQYIPPPIVNYVNCERHKGMSYTIRGTFACSAFAAATVCPICHPPTDSPA